MKILLIFPNNKSKTYKMKINKIKINLFNNNTTIKKI